jgi:hypothetical protein
VGVVGGVVLDARGEEAEGAKGAKEGGEVGDGVAVSVEEDEVNGVTTDRFGWQEDTTGGVDASGDVDGGLELRFRGIVIGFDVAAVGETLPGVGLGPVVLGPVGLGPVGLGPVGLGPVGLGPVGQGPGGLEIDSVGVGEEIGWAVLVVEGEIGGELETRIVGEVGFCDADFILVLDVALGVEDGGGEVETGLVELVGDECRELCWGVLGS